MPPGRCGSTRQAAATARACAAAPNLCAWVGASGPTARALLPAAGAVPPAAVAAAVPLRPRSRPLRLLPPLGAARRRSRASSGCSSSSCPAPRPASSLPLASLSVKSASGSAAWTPNHRGASLFMRAGHDDEQPWICPGNAGKAAHTQPTCSPPLTRVFKPVVGGILAASRACNPPLAPRATATSGGGSAACAPCTSAALRRVAAAPAAAAAGWLGSSVPCKPV